MNAGEAWIFGLGAVFTGAKAADGLAGNTIPFCGEAFAVGEVKRGAAGLSS